MHETSLQVVSLYVAGWVLLHTCKRRLQLDNDCLQEQLACQLFKPSDINNINTY